MNTTNQPAHEDKFEASFLLLTERDPEILTVDKEMVMKDLRIESIRIGKRLEGFIQDINSVIVFDDYVDFNCNTEESKESLYNLLKDEEHLKLVGTEFGFRLTFTLEPTIDVPQFSTKEHIHLHCSAFITAVFESLGAKTLWYHTKQMK